jgi:hypothetical protein
LIWEGLVRLRMRIRNNLGTSLYRARAQDVTSHSTVAMPYYPARQTNLCAYFYRINSVNVDIIRLMTILFAF